MAVTGTPLCPGPTYQWEKEGKRGTAMGQWPSASIGTGKAAMDFLGKASPMVSCLGKDVWLVDDARGGSPWLVVGSTVAVGIRDSDGGSP